MEGDNVGLTQMEKIGLIRRIPLIKMNVLPRMLFLFQIIRILIKDSSFKQRQKDIYKFIWQNIKTRIKYKLLQDAKEWGGLGLLDLILYYEACCLVWLKDWIILKNPNFVRPWRFWFEIWVGCLFVVS